jgi:PIN domain nuclease of toxin-antitoxin system
VTQRFLLDSHAFLWAVFSPEQFGSGARQLVAQADALYVSTVSLWELAIKYRIGKFVHQPEDLFTELAELGADELTITHRHLGQLPRITLPHGDPFDTMLVAQASTEGLVLVTADRALTSSGYETLDARS